MYRKYYGLRNKPFCDAPDAGLRTVPFTEEELRAHVSHRLQAAGAGRAIFTAAALKKIHERTGGDPGSAGLLCDHALQAGFMVGKKTIDCRLVIACARELNATLPGGLSRLRPERNEALKENSGPASPAGAIKASPRAPAKSARLPVKRLALAAAVLLLVVSVGYALYGHLYISATGNMSSETAVNNLVEVLQTRADGAGPLAGHLSFGHQMAEDAAVADPGPAPPRVSGSARAPVQHEERIIRRKIEVPASLKIEIADTF